MKRKNQKTMYVVFLALVLMVGVGYALLSANLKINGTTRIADITWDVHFENAEATENSTVEPTTAPSAPAASKLQTISYDVTFDTPGQVYEFIVDVVNGGTIDAMIEHFTSKIKVGDAEEVAIASDKSNLPAYLDYSVTYEDGTAIADNHELKHNTSETIKVTVTFKNDITSAQLLEAKNKVIKLNVGLDYKQADGTEVAVPHPAEPVVVSKYAQSFDGNQFKIGESISGDYQTTDNLPENFSNYYDYYLKFDLDDEDKISKAYLLFSISQSDAELYSGLKKGVYTLIGGDSGDAYSDNRQTLLDAFGEDNCDENSSSISCSNGNDYGDYENPRIYVSVAKTGYVYADNEDSLYCTIGMWSSNEAHCSYG